MLTINIHKGFTAFNRRFIFRNFATPCVPSAPILFACRKYGRARSSSAACGKLARYLALEFLADTMWSDFAYGRNAVYPKDITVTPFFHVIPLNIMRIGCFGRWCGKARRALLPHCAAMTGKAIHVMCVHLGLREAHRRRSLRCSPNG